VLKQVLTADHAFCNSVHTQNILLNIYGLQTSLFYSGLIPFYNKYPTVTDTGSREYSYGIIASNFDRQIKNTDAVINYIINTGKKAILIGKNSNKYASNQFTCIDLQPPDKLTDYYKKIQTIIQSSFYESCSNVKLEAIFHGCQFINFI
jgi:hypothetical protein